MGWWKEAANFKEEFPIENLPMETFGDKRGDALALLYKRPDELPEAAKAKRLPASLQIDRRKEEFFARILPILDGFDNIFRYVERSNLEGNETVSNWLKTLESLYRRLISALEKEGLCAIESEGMSLDLSIHEVIDTREQPGVPNNTVIEEVVRGYRFGRRTLRDAKVIVAKNPAALEE
ncbi:MAG: nucleotide exchange factor GrpE [Candidatus Omnitrophota bacterium]